MSVQAVDSGSPDASPMPADQLEAQAPAPAAADPDTEAQTSPIKEPKLCGVCNTEPPRYKCPRCLLPYCSLACSKTHKQTHANDPPPAPKVPSPPPPEPTPAHAGRPGTIAGSRARAGGPFAGLETLPELHALFERYPSLPSQLDAIFRETLPPDGTNKPSAERRGGFGRRHPREDGPWTHDRGLERGVRALGIARDGWGVEADGVREFGELVLRVVEGADGKGGEDAAREGQGDQWGGVWREEVEESVRAVERLLKAEDRGR